MFERVSLDFDGQRAVFYAAKISQALDQICTLIVLNKRMMEAVKKGDFSKAASISKLFIQEG